MRYIFLALTLVLLLVRPAIAQDDDVGFLTRTLQDALSGAGREVKIEGFAGALSSEATFDRLTIADDAGIWLTVEDVTLNWSRLALLRGRVDVTELSASRIDMPRLPQASADTVEIPAAEAQGFSLPELPVSIDIKALNVDEIALGAPLLGEAVTLSTQSRVLLDDTGLDADINAERIDGQSGVFAIKATFARDTSALVVDLQLDEESGGIVSRVLNLPGTPSVRLAVAGEGPLSDFSADVELATEGEQRLEGVIATSVAQTDNPEAPADRRIQADISGDIAPLIAPEYRDFFGTDVGLVTQAVLGADGTVVVDQFDLRARSLNLTGTVALNQDRWPVLFDIKGQMQSPDGAPTLLPGAGGATVQTATLDVQYDAAEGEAFRGVFDLSQFKQTGMSLDRAKLDVDGILQGELGSVGQFLVDIGFDATGVDLADAEVSRAVGDAITGNARVNYIEGQPVRINDIVVTGEGLDLSGWSIIGAFADGFPTRFALDVDADDLARFAGIIGQPVSGAAALAVSGKATPLAGTFDIGVRGQTTDLGVGVTQVDTLLRGNTRLTLIAARNDQGTFIRNLDLNNGALSAKADAALRTDDSEVTATARLRDVALIAPRYSGSLTAEIAANQDIRGWSVNATLDAPYEAKAVVRGLATGPDADLNLTLSMPDVKPVVPGASGPLQADVRLRQTEPGWVTDLSASGPFDGTLTASGLVTGPDAALSFEGALPNMAVLVPQIPGPLSIRGDVARQGEDWALDTVVDGPSGTRADLEGVVLGDGTLDIAASGNVPLGLSRPFLAPRSLEGQASFDLRVDGPAALSSVSGQINTTNASFSAPTLRVALRNLATAITLQNGRADVQTSADIVAGGRMTAAGSIALSDGYSANLQVTLANAILIDPQLYRTDLNGDISIVGPLTGGARIDGRIDVAETNVTVPASSLTTIGDIPDIRHIGSPAAATATRQRSGVTTAASAGQSQTASGPAYRLNLQVNAPNRIFVRGRGVDAELGGALTLTGTTQNVISAGKFELIRGHINILAKRFELVEGTTQFQGSLTPYILFETRSTTSVGTASIVVEGPATEPEVSFTSDPEAPQDEVLAQLLFGRNLSQISALQAIELANAVATLAGSGGKSIIGSLREGFGLDDLDVTTDDDGVTAVRVGKYISENAYTDITTTSEGESEVSLNLDVSESLTAKGSVDSEGNTGIGLFFERDY